MSEHDAPPGARSTILETVRRSCAEVARRAVSVSVATERIPSYGDLLLKEAKGEPEMDPALHHLGRGDETVAFLVTLDAVNFGSGYFPEILPDPRLSGFRAVAAPLAARFAEKGSIPAQELAETSTEEAARLVGLDSGHPPARELASLFARSWRELGRFVLAKFDGSFPQLVRAAGGSAERLVTLLAAMPLYRDVAAYGSLTVPFYKRAQITAADLHIAFRGEGPGYFADIDALTLFADNLVPHVLRLDGILEYAPQLAGRIDRGERLEAGSPEEVEIRACAVWAVELLVAELHRRGAPVNPLLLDNRLWHRGQGSRYRDRPRHRTRTPFY